MMDAMYRAAIGIENLIKTATNKAQLSRANDLLQEFIDASKAKPSDKANNAIKALSNLLGMKLNLLDPKNLN